ncbi:PAS domain-containing protein [Massilia sp. MS-15]|uniref:PAS domain-containing protein n=1 Tax=Massilia sp. MS-15 TaxID=2878200 RepID=UPI001CD479FE|nr:PAS domain-containing protein [Massilia sp. MS-15]MCA1248559.1 PAS domain-containing protein [Massilia sp. MS-15]
MSGLPHAADGALPAEAHESAGPGRQARDWLSRFVTAIALAPAVAVHSTDAAGIVRFWNHACAQLFGIPPAMPWAVPCASWSRIAGAWTSSRSTAVSSPTSSTTRGMGP